MIQCYHMNVTYVLRLCYGLVKTVIGEIYYVNLNRLFTLSN